ncbi:MAG: threonine synthase, partial [Pedobacter sp.]
MSFTDEETKNLLKETYKEYGYLLDPHGAVGMLGLNEWLTSHPSHKGIFLETAHPVKFYDAVQPLIGEKVPIPAKIQEQMLMDKKSVKLDAEDH